jgi:hypothetical protein
MLSNKYRRIIIIPFSGNFTVAKGNLPLFCRKQVLPRLITTVLKVILQGMAALLHIYVWIRDDTFVSFQSSLVYESDALLDALVQFLLCHLQAHSVAPK